jgi:hypothetical protein
MDFNQSSSDHLGLEQGTSGPSSDSLSPTVDRRALQNRHDNALIAAVALQAGHHETLAPRITSQTAAHEADFNIFDAVTTAVNDSQRLRLSSLESHSSDMSPLPLMDNHALCSAALLANSGDEPLSPQSRDFLSRRLADPDTSHLPANPVRSLPPPDMPANQTALTVYAPVRQSRSSSQPDNNEGFDYARTEFAPPADSWSDRTSHTEETNDPDYDPLPLPRGEAATDDTSSVTMGASDDRLDGRDDIHQYDISMATNRSEQQRASPLSASSALGLRNSSSRSPAHDWPMPSNSMPTVWTLIRITNDPPSDPHAHVQVGNHHTPIVDYYSPNVLYLAHTNSSSSSSSHWLATDVVYFCIKTCHERYAFAPRSTHTEPVQICQALLQRLWRCGLVLWSMATAAAVPNAGGGGGGGGGGGQPVHSIPDSMRRLSLFLNQRCYVDLNADCDVLNGRGGHGRRFVGHQAFLDRRDELRTVY